MPFTPVTITDSELRGDATSPAQQATYTFTLSDAIADGAGARIAKRQTVVGYGLGDGRLSLSASTYVPVVLAANDDPTTQPVGTTWHLDARIDGQPQKRLTFVVPHTAPGGTLDLATVAPALPTAPAYNYALASALTAETDARVAGDAARAFGLTRTSVKTTNYTATAGDLIPVDTTSGAVTITLPSAPADRTRIAVKHVAPNPLVNSATIVTSGADTVNRASGGTSLSIVTAFQGWWLQYDSASKTWTAQDSVALSSLDARYTQIASSQVPAVTVLQWDHATPQSVNHGRMWPVGVDLGPFWWECWCAPTAGAEYWISEGYGGAHALLAGFGGGPPFSPTGNVWNGTASTTFTGVYSAQTGEWLNYTVVWDGTTIWVLINGMVCGVVPFAGPRRAQFGTLAIGGTDHSNFAGRIAQVRAWEGLIPATYPWLAVGQGPERYFGDTWAGWASGAGIVPCQFATSYLEPTDTFPDISAGFGGRLHPGHSYAGSGVGIDTPAPHPTRVVDATAPFGTQYSVARTRTFAAPAAVPAGSKIWDSFGRADDIPAFHPTSLAVSLPPLAIGTTEGGSLGPLTWTHTTGYWGIFDGCAVCFHFYQFARVANNSADMDVRVGRVVNSTAGLYYCSAAARIKADLSTGWAAFTTSATTVTLYRPDGTQAGSWTPGSTTWKWLRIVTAGTTITVYVDNGTLDGQGRPAGWTQLGQVTGETQNQAEQGAGMYHYFGVGTAARYTDFEVR